ncbi:hypothetical protein IW245_002274 [Longispora fulva]|uniref:Uncharacterized protein n=1 Tax=Longispora fulva TaxID=619741 RepID=A0A8J7KFE4_9ACTN|nr:hypothetical protein [Longispora fulva]
MALPMTPNERRSFTRQPPVNHLRAVHPDLDRLADALGRVHHRR